MFIFSEVSIPPRFGFDIIPCNAPDRAFAVWAVFGPEEGEEELEFGWVDGCDDWDCVCWGCWGWVWPGMNPGISPPNMPWRFGSTAFKELVIIFARFWGEFCWVWGFVEFPLLLWLWLCWVWVEVLEIFEAKFKGIGSLATIWTDTTGWPRGNPNWACCCCCCCWCCCGCWGCCCCWAWGCCCPKVNSPGLFPNLKLL